jgi:2-polyprenyl-6-methoxyphenol hydroxylase-like FAD-dependent oxidoreductase
VRLYGRAARNPRIDRGVILTNMHNESCEVLVIGGGPAGSTLAALLAERGRDVVLLEKEHHPRFHIGESLLPLNLPLFERLGVAAEVERIGMPKHGAEFVSPWHANAVTFDFARQLDKSYPYAYQVRRSEFDEILFRNAQRRGARALEGCRVAAVDFAPESATVAARLEDGSERRWTARFIADASGRDTFLASRMGIKRRNKKHNSAAIYGHFSGAARLPGKAEGNITVFWFEHGWFWFIPLSDGATSVGAVCWPYYLKTRETSTERFLLDTIQLCPPLAERLREARLDSPVTATGNYSYVAERSIGRNYLMLGDAYTFIDPVFSTGVLLAMQSAFTGADTIQTCLDEPRKAGAALKRFDAMMRRGPGIFSWLIYRITTPAIRDLFMAPSEKFGLQGSIISVLAGDIYRQTPWRRGLRLFQLIYYLKSLSSLRQSVSAWFRRRRAIQSL